MAQTLADLIYLINVLNNNGTFNARSLNVKSPNVPLSVNNNWNILQNLMSKDNTNKNFEQLLKNLTSNATSYNTTVLIFRDLINNINIATGKIGRILVALPDGTVYFDSSKPDGVINNRTDTNLFTNAQARTINENHNTRPSIMCSQTLQSGFGFESKFSSSTTQIEDYVAMRIGIQGYNLGTIRYSCA